MKAEAYLVPPTPEVQEERIMLNLSIEEFALIYTLAYRGLNGSNALRNRFEEDLDMALFKKALSDDEKFVR